MLVKGMAAPGGDFHVRDVRYATMAPQAPLPPPSGLSRAVHELRVPSQPVRCNGVARMRPTLGHVHYSPGLGLVPS